MWSSSILGLQIDGYIADTATTVDLGNNALLLEASREALEAAIQVVRPGVTAGELGAIVQNEIERRGYRPIANLTGHGLDQYVLHRDPTIPNIAINGGTVLEEGMAFAIEPFATTGSGRVGEKTRVEISLPDRGKARSGSRQPVRSWSGSGTGRVSPSHAAGSTIKRWISHSPGL